MTLAWWGGERATTVSIATRNGNICLLFLSLFITCLERKPWSYSWIWVNSWQRKWSNPFCTCKAGLTNQMQDRTPVSSAELVSPVPCGTGSRTRNWVWVWGWRNILPAIIVSRTPAQNSFALCLTSHFPPLLNRITRALHADEGQRHPPEARTQKMAEEKKTEERYWRKKLGIWHKNLGPVRKREDKRDRIWL